VVSFFTPRFGFGGQISILFLIAFVGILSAISVPVYQSYLRQSEYSAAVGAAEKVKDEATVFLYNNKMLPDSLRSLGYDTDIVVDDDSGVSISILEDGVIRTKVGTNDVGETEYIIIEPVATNGLYSWVCYGENIPSENLPKNCR
jgi:Tfp pilus assembly major pilin PilA